MRTFRIYSLSNFQVHSIAVLTIVTIMYITFLVHIYLITRSLYILTVFTNISTLASDNHQCILCLYEYGFLDSTYK